MIAIYSQTLNMFSILHYFYNDVSFKEFIATVRYCNQEFAEKAPTPHPGFVLNPLRV
jgi:hypothetical protein